MLDDASMLRNYKTAIGAEELSEEQLAEFKTNHQTYLDTIEAPYMEYLDELIATGRVRVHSLDVGDSLETLENDLKEFLGAKVILVNHEKRLPVDAVCANLAIKYQMLYLSVYQILRQHIERRTAYGKALLQTKKPKSIELSA